MKRDRKEPLYRKEKKTGLQTRYFIRTGGEYRWGRNTKQAKKDAENEVSHLPINGKNAIKRKGFGYDYTPLFRFLLSKVGKPWDEVYSEAKSRLDREDPIWWMVDEPNEPLRGHQDPNDPYCRIGEGSMWSRLKIDDEGILVKVDPEANTPIWFGCTCHTQSFNGVPYKNDNEANKKWNEDRTFGKPNKDVTQE